MYLKKVLIPFMVILTILIFNFSSFGQIKYTSTKWKSPLLTIEVAGSYNLPIQESKGELGDFFRFKNYGTSIGWGAQFNFKFGLGDKGTYRPYVFLGYSQLFGSSDDSAFIGTNYIQYGYPLKGSALYSAVKGVSAIIIRIPYAGLGFEYAFTETDPKKRQYIPFIGTEFFLSVITGKYRQTADNVPFNAGVETPYIIKPDVRFGIGIGAGMDMRFTKGFGMVFGFKYKHSNLIGKTSDFLMEENKMNLLDAADTELNTNLKENRNLAFFEFYLGASFFVGKSRK